MPHPAVSIPRDNAPVFDLCHEREKRFLLDLMQQEEPGARADHPIPELHALLFALEHMWGGECAKQLTVPPELIYYLVAYATYAHHIPEEPEEWRSGAAHDVHQILRGFMESVTLAIKDGILVTHANDGVYIDLFRIPPWLYDEVMKDQQLCA